VRFEEEEDETRTTCPACAGKGSKSLAPEQVGFYRFVICALCRGLGLVTASAAVRWKLERLADEI
jgi:formate dehydrogenase maturation protein FdhE